MRDKRIKEIVEAFKRDAARSHKETVQRPKEIAQKRKPIDEINTKKNYSGEASPYWDFIQGRQRQDREGSPLEDVLANPDMLTEEDTLYGRSLTEVGELQLAAIQETMPKLSRRERQAMLICTRTIDEIAQDMDVTPRTVRMLLDRARSKITKCYNRKVLQNSCRVLGQ